MAFLGDLGKFFNIETGEAAEIGANILSGNIPGAIASGIEAVTTPIPSGGGAPADVSGPPAGVDSPATLTNVSQTGQVMSGGGFGMAGGFSPNVTTAGFGGLAPFVFGGLGSAGKSLLSKPGVVGTVGGLAAGGVIDFFIDQFGQTKKLVITRKMQRDVKKLFMMSGGNFNMTAELYRMATGRSITPEQVVKIITKTFKNQGPYVTKAAVRKTRATIRKMETLCDLKDRLCPPKPARRRAPARRMSTSITQVK